MIKAVIVDDEPDAIKILSTFISINFPRITLTGRYDQSAEAIKALRKDPPDILFLDIDMPGKNGFELLKAIGHGNTHCIFVTAHQQYAIQAIKMNVADYLLKPVDEEEFIEAIHKVLSKIDKEEQVNYQAFLRAMKLQTPRIHVPTGRGVQFIDSAQIMYIKADGNYSVIFLEKGKKLTAIRKIHEFEDLLAPYSTFMRVHKSYMVNLEKIYEFVKEGYLYMLDGSEVPISRKYRNKLKERLGI